MKIPVGRRISNSLTLIPSGIYGLLLLVVAAIGPVPAARAAGTDLDTQPRPDSATAAAEGGLVDIYLDLCLNRFPDEAAFGLGATARNLEPMSPEGVKRFLHDDPGRGWVGQSPSGSYVVTLESPPYLACAVRRMQKPSATFQSFFDIAIGTWTAAHKIPGTRNFPPMRQERSGVTIDIHAQGIVGPDGKATQTFMLIVTDYPNGKSEVRLVRQFPPK